MRDQPIPFSRREAVVGGASMLAAPIALSLAGTALAQEGHPARGATAAQPQQPAQPPQGLKDPRTTYPKPPFPKQTQERPGLASKMNPVPDHGEKTYHGSGKLLGRRALVTGGDSGIGRAAAIAYAREGADVAINYLPQEESDAKEVIALIKEAGRKGVAIPGDIRDEAFCAQLVDRAASELGGLDIVVNNAGMQMFVESLEDVTSENFDSTFKTNVYAPFWITKAALKHLKPGSCVIVTSSILGYDPSPGLVDYSMTKACNVSFVKSLSKQLVPKGIRVNGVAPGPIWTPLQSSGGQDPEKLPEFGGDTPFGRPGQPAELAATYVLLASDDSAYVSGEVHGVTG
ncbi:MAG TPA: SDR family oxidoreductase, partial [Phycisphaerales bacterium]|nr:SDR family oxidoreductase [Phycisphaerales bacterium]